MAQKKILLYSHDSYGLGHLRRSQTIAEALVVADPTVSIIIVSGSPVIGRFEYPHGVDFVRIPGVIKLHNGDYSSHQLTCPIKELIQIRSDLILQTYHSFKPDLIIVDKEPLGLRGEMRATLEAAQDDQIAVILGVREILDDREALTQEWTRKKIFPILDQYYQEIWVYGPQQMGNPLEGLPLSEKVERKTHFTGYLHRAQKSSSAPLLSANKISLEEPYLLVMAGGGGDGEDLMRAVIRLYEEKAGGLLPALLLLGPFMPQEIKDELQRRAEKLSKVELVYFSNQVEELIAKAQAIIAMGGYNSFCEILSFKKPALVYPRTKPRQEQLIRIQKAADLGVVGHLTDEDIENVNLFHDRIMSLQSSDQLSHDFSLNGLEWIGARIKNFLS